MIGRRPNAAFDYSVGDCGMLEYAGAGDGARLMMLVMRPANTPTTRRAACPTASSVLRATRRRR